MRSWRFLLLIFFALAGAVHFVYAAEKIDINTAPLEDLIKIIHIGETRALELISLRPFISLDDLTRIKGIGEKRVENIKNQGLAWVNPELQSEFSQTGDTQKSAKVKLAPKTPRADEEAPSKLVGPDSSASGKTNDAALVFAAVFTSFLGGGIILILKKNLKLN